MSRSKRREPGDRYSVLRSASDDKTVHSESGNRTASRLVGKRMNRNRITEALLVALVCSPAALYLMIGLNPLRLSTLLALGLAALVFIQLSTRTLTIFAVAAPLVPWTLGGVEGLPAAAGRLPIGVLVSAAALCTILSRKMSLREYGALRSSRSTACRWLIASTATLTLLALINGSTITAIPWLIGCGLVWHLTSADKRLPNQMSLLASLLVTQACIATWDLAARVTHSQVLPSMRPLTTLLLEDGTSIPRFAGTLGDYELYGELNGIFAAGCVALALFSSGSRKRLAWAATGIPLAMVAALSGTRGALVASVLTLLLVAVRLGRVRRLLLLVPALLMALSMGVTLPIFSRMSRVFHESSLTEAINRRSVWSAFTEATSGDLWTAFGHQPGLMFEQIGFYPHNLGLAMLYEYGIIPTAMFLVSSGAVILSAWRIAGSRGALASAIISSMLIAQLVHELKIEFVRLPTSTLTFLAIIAVAARGVQPYVAEEPRASLDALNTHSSTEVGER